MERESVVCGFENAKLSNTCPKSSEEVICTLIDENLPIINKSKHPKKKRVNTRNKMEGPTSKKTKEPTKEG